MSDSNCLVFKIDLLAFGGKPVCKISKKSIDLFKENERWPDIINEKLNATFSDFCS